MQIEQIYRGLYYGLMWIIVVGFFIFAVISSHDYTKEYYNLGSFGTNQIIIFGFIVIFMIILFLGIHTGKSKFEKFEDELKNLITNLEDSTKFIELAKVKVQNEELDKAKSELDKAKSMVELINQKLKRY